MRVENGIFYAKIGVQRKDEVESDIHCYSIMIIYLSQCHVCCLNLF